MVAFSIGKEKRMPIQGKKGPDPGPGNYNPKPDGGVIKQAAPQWRIGTEKRDQAPGSRKPGSPGPGAYPLPSLLQTGPKWVMAEKTAKRMNTSLGPGPGWYEHQDTKMKIAFSMGGKSESKKSSDMMNRTLPGPGQYTPRDAFYRSTGGKIGTEKRVGPISRANFLGPGPGQYDSKNNLSVNDMPKYGFGTQQKFFQNRQKERNLKSSPGPGAYEAKLLIGREGQKYSMGDNKPTKPMAVDTVPGPGTYEFGFKPMTPQYRIGTAKRSDTQTVRYAANPSPDAYTPRDVTKRSAPNWRFGSDKRAGLTRSLNPGPGTYESKNRAVEGSKFSFGLKVQPKQKVAEPGPGQYSPVSEKVKNKAPAYVLGTGPKMGKMERNTVAPGPGQYSPATKDGSAKYGFGSSPRDPKKIQGTPGPGQYKIPVKIAENPDFILRKKEEFKFV